MMIRTYQLTDHSEWLRMRDALWPGLPAELHQREMAASQSNGKAKVFVADRENGRLGGFLEMGERSFADGCLSSPVAYIEGWYVDPDLRQQGVGGALVKAAEQYARDHGYHEIASDCEIENTLSLSSHCALGYRETMRLIHFRKSLTATD